MKKPERKGLLHGREFKTLSDEKYARRTDQNIGYNLAWIDYDKYFDYLLNQIPSDKQIEESPHPEYAKAYYQGRFDILMELKTK